MNKNKFQKTKIICFFLASIFIFALILSSCRSLQSPKSKETDETEKVSIKIEETTDFIDELTESRDWEYALERTETENSLLPLIDYADSHPNSIYFFEAGRLIKQMQNDSSYSEKCLKDPDLDSIDEFVLNFPGHKDIEKALELRKDFVGDIFSMMQKKYIDVYAVGESIERSWIAVRNNTNSRLEITLPLGTYLAANAGYVQNMLVCKEKTFAVKSKETESISIETACMNIYKDTPDETSYFWINRLESDSHVLKLIKILNENNASYEVAQAAIWHITDNPGKDAILGALEYDDGTKAITEKDYNEAMRLVKLAGINK